MPGNWPVRFGKGRLETQVRLCAGRLLHFVIGIIGSKADAVAMKSWLSAYLSTELHLELSDEKTLITHVDERVRFLGYDIIRWDARQKTRKFPTSYGVVS